jgi:hypothetical protein
MAVHTLNELVHTFQELYRPNSVITDSIDNRLWAKFIQSTRAKLLKQRLDAPFKLIDVKNIQSLGTVTMESVTTSNGKYVIRSSEAIPWTIHTKTGPTFTRISSIDKLNVNYRYVDRERAMVSGNGKFNKDTIYAYIDEGKLYLTSKTNLHKYIDSIELQGIFENPIDAYEFRYGVGTYNWDLEYPISESLINDIKNIIVQENFQLIMVPIDDKKPNSIDNIANPSPEEVDIENPMRRRR